MQHSTWKNAVCSPFVTKCLATCIGDDASQTALRVPYMPHQGQMGDSLDMLPCSTVFWLNNNIVVCSSSHGKGTSASIAIGPAPSTYSGTLMGAFSFDAPVVTFLALDNAPTVGGSLITITGMNMGTELSETNQVDISVAGNECSSSAFISNTPFSSVKWIF